MKSGIRRPRPGDHYRHNTEVCRQPPHADRPHAHVHVFRPAAPLRRASPQASCSSPGNTSRSLGRSVEPRLCSGGKWVISWSWRRRRSITNTNRRAKRWPTRHCRRRTAGNALRKLRSHSRPLRRGRAGWVAISRDPFGFDGKAGRHGDMHRRPSGVSGGDESGGAGHDLLLRHGHSQAEPRRRNERQHARPHFRGRNAVEDGDRS